MKRLSLQSHQFREECWHVIRGTGKAVRGDAVMAIQPHDVIRIDRGQKHRLINDSSDTDLEIVEIQQGSYFGEDDIVRYEDDFGR